VIRRGAIHLVDFDPVVGAESNNTRPAIVISNDAANSAAVRHGHGVVTVVPITSAVDRVYPFQVFLTAADCGLEVDSKAQAEQIRAVDVSRLGDRVGAVASGSLQELEEAVRLHLVL
jgi:mRNA interferase MazF